MVRFISKNIKYALTTVAFFAVPPSAHAGAMARGSGYLSGHVQSKPNVGKVYGAQQSAALMVAKPVQMAKLPRVMRSQDVNRHSAYQHHMRMREQSFNRGFASAGFVNTGYGGQSYSGYQSAGSSYSAEPSYTYAVDYPTSYYEHQAPVAAPKFIQIEALKARHSRVLTLLPKVVYGSDSRITRYNDTYSADIVRVRVFKD